MLTLFSASYHGHYLSLYCHCPLEQNHCIPLWTSNPTTRNEPSQYVGVVSNGHYNGRVNRLIESSLSAWEWLIKPLTTSPMFRRMNVGLRFAKVIQCKEKPGVKTGSSWIKSIRVTIQTGMPWESLHLIALHTGSYTDQTNLTNKFWPTWIRPAIVCSASIKVGI